MIRLSLPKGLSPTKEVTDSRYSMFNTGGVELETAEFLYTFVRILKPETIVETGAHLGISALYMAAGMLENSQKVCNRIITCEVIPELIHIAKMTWKENSVDHLIDIRNCYSLELDVQQEIDLLFLDSEPQYRYDELLKFFPKVRDRGFILIHDLLPEMKCREATSPETCPLFGNYKDKIGNLLKEFSLVPIHLPCPRGMVLLQKDVGGTLETTRFIRSRK